MTYCKKHRDELNICPEKAISQSMFLSTFPLCDVSKGSNPPLRYLILNE